MFLKFWQILRVVRKKLQYLHDHRRKNTVEPTMAETLRVSIQYMAYNNTIQRSANILDKDMKLCKLFKKIVIMV